MSSEIYDVIIIGSGPAGFTAAIYCQRFLLRTIVVAGRTWGGQLQNTTEVENFPGMGLIQGPILMKKMRDHVLDLKIPIHDEWVTALDPSKQPFAVTLEEGKVIFGKSVIIATGADTKWMGVPNEVRLRGKGVSACAPCDAFFFRGKPVAVVGGGDTAMEETQVIANVASNVVLIHRRDEFKAQAAMVQKAKSKKNVRCLYNTTVIDVLGDPTLSGLLLETKTISPKQGVSSFDELVVSFGGKKLEKGQKGTKTQWILPRAGVFVAIGLIPNTQFLRGFDLDSHGYLARREERSDTGSIVYTTKTKFEGIFTAGDVHDTRYKQAITAAGFGCMAALDVEKWLHDK